MLAPTFALPDPGPAKHPDPLAPLLALVAAWPQLDELLLACRSSEPSYRRRHAISALLSCSRAEMVAALLAQRARKPDTPEREDTSLAILVLNGAVRFEAVSCLRAGGLRTLMAHWRVPPHVTDEAVDRLSAAVAPPAIFGAA